MARWLVEHSLGTAAEFHARPVPSPVVPTIWSFDISGPALVLGSSQPLETADAEACAGRGVEVARRHSGGGAVLLVPTEMVWLDVLLPPTDPHFDADVGRSMWWIGARCAAALAKLGVPGPTVHRGPLLRSTWSTQVCFAGVGSGEVTVGTSKAVGISQRRTREGARFQVMVSLRWRPELIAELLCPPRPGPTDLAGLGTDLGLDPELVRSELIAHLQAP